MRSVVSIDMMRMNRRPVLCQRSGSASRTGRRILVIHQRQLAGDRDVRSGRGACIRAGDRIRGEDHLDNDRDGLEQKEF